MDRHAGTEIRKCKLPSFEHQSTICSINCKKDSADKRKRIHKEGQKDNDLAIPAKRVLNLADVATGIVRIVETANHKGRYVALSHWWIHCLCIV